MSAHSSPIQVRPAAERDVAFLVQCNLAMAQETEGRELKPDVLAAGVQRVLREPQAGFYLVAQRTDPAEATAASGNVGCLLVTFEWSDWRNGRFWWIQSVYVLPAHRRQGVFRTLFKHTGELARQRDDVCGLRLYVEQENEAARETYHQLGMRQTPYQLFELDWHGS